MKSLFWLLAISFVSLNSHAEVPLCKQSMENVTCGSAAVVKEYLSMAPGSSFECRISFNDCEGSGYAIENWSVAPWVESKFQGQYTLSDEVKLELIDANTNLPFDITSIGGSFSRSRASVPGIVPNDISLILKVTRSASSSKSKKVQRNMDVMLDSNGNMILDP